MCSLKAIKYVFVGKLKCLILCRMAITSDLNLQRELQFLGITF